MEEYKETCKDGVNGFQKAVDSLIDKLMRDLEDQFKEDVKVQQSSESYVVQDIKLRKRESSHLTFFCYFLPLWSYSKTGHPNT